MSPFPYPRSYIDCDVPLLPDGTKLWRARSKAEYDMYLDWLADYLFVKDIPIPECQKDITADILSLAKELTITPIIDEIEYHEESGKGFAGLHEMELETWNREPDDLKQEYIDENGQNVFFTTEEQFNRVASEYVERRRMLPDGIDGHADIPYRPLLARHLKKIPKHEDRVSALHGYFTRIAENLGK